DRHRAVRTGLAHHAVGEGDVIDVGRDQRAGRGRILGGRQRAVLRHRWVVDGSDGDGDRRRVAGADARVGVEGGGGRAVVVGGRAVAVGVGIDVGDRDRTVRVGLADYAVGQGAVFDVAR